MFRSSRLSPRGDRHFQRRIPRDSHHVSYMHALFNASYSSEHMSPGQRAHQHVCTRNRTFSNKHILPHTLERAYGGRLRISPGAHHLFQMAFFPGAVFKTWEPANMKSGLETHRCGNRYFVDSDSSTITSSGARKGVQCRTD